MNIYDVSEHAGASIATVSKVLNDNANVSEKTKEEVLKVVDDLGYTPNVFARGLGLSTVQTTGTIYSDSSDPYLADAIYYLKRGFRPHSYDVILCCAEYDLGAKQKYFGFLHSKRVDVIILAGSKLAEICSKDSTYTAEAVTNPPVMLVNGYLKGDSVYSTVCDDHVAIFGAVIQLLQADRRRILYLYTSCSYSGVNKLEGYKDALKTFGVEPKDEPIHQCPKDIGASKRLLSSLREQELSSDAVMTSDNSLAVGTVKHAHEVGTPILGELNITRYNSSILSRYTDPETTSVDSKVEALYTTTINTLMGVFNGIDVPSQTMAASDLIRRRTTNF